MPYRACDLTPLQNYPTEYFSAETARPNYNNPEAKPERQKPNNYNTKVRKIDIKNIHFYKKRFPCPGVPKRFLQIKNGALLNNIIIDYRAVLRRAIQSLRLDAHQKILIDSIPPIRPSLAETNLMA